MVSFDKYLPAGNSAIRVSGNQTTHSAVKLRPYITARKTRYSVVGFLVELL